MRFGYTQNKNLDVLYIVTMESATKSFTKVLESPTVIAVAATFTALYTSTIGPELPGYVKDLFQNSYFKAFVVFVVAYLSSKRKPVIAVIAAASFMFITSLLAQENVVERYSDRR